MKLPENMYPNGHPNNMTTEANRREFEEWAKQEGLSVDKRTEGYYNCGHAVVAWEAWQAARERVTEQRDRLAEAVNAATTLIAAKGRHNTMLAYNGLREALQSLTTNEQ
jgi:hypothetical protein